MIDNKYQFCSMLLWKSVSEFKTKSLNYFGHACVHCYIWVPPTPGLDNTKITVAIKFVENYSYNYQEKYITKWYMKNLCIVGDGISDNFWEKNILVNLNDVIGPKVILSHIT